MTIKIDPLNPTARPEIIFSGSDNEVKKQEADVSNNIHVRFMHNIGYNSNIYLTSKNLFFYRNGIRITVF